MSRRTALVLALSSLVPRVACLAQVDSTAARVDRIFAEWDRTNTPGCAVGVSRDGTIVYQRGYGMSNLEHAIAITPRSIFHVASISKQFTAFSILLLEKDGKLSVDDDVRKYVPELPSYGKTITIDHLIHHTSGLRDQWSLLGMADWRADDLITEDDVLRIASRQKSLNFEPGDEYVYSNTGYTLLAMIVKRVSGQSLRDYADANIFKPLGMNDTHFHDDHTMIVPNRTQAYVPRAGGGWRISIPVFDTYGATSLFTTVADLLTWEQNFADARVGGPAVVARLQERGKLTSGDAITYARGVIVGSVRGLRTVGHSGADAGYRADVVRFPDQGFAFTALCNLGPINPAALTRRVAEVYLGDRMSPRPANVASSNGGAHLTEQQLARHAGVYWNSRTDDLWRFAVRNGALVWQSGGDVRLTPVNENRFTAPEQGLEFNFLTQMGVATQLRFIAEGQRPAMLVRTEPFAPNGSQLAAYTGRYYADELDAAYDVTVRNDTLVMRSRKGTESILRPVTVDVFQAGGGLGVVRFTRDGKGKVTSYLVSNGRVRRLKFDRVK